jgi:DNA-binding NarL/FixJ family response regulator
VKVVENPIRILLADRHRIALWGLERLVVGSKSGKNIVGKATDCAEAVALALDTRPDVIVLSSDLGSQSVLEIIPELISKAGTRVVVLAGKSDPSMLESAVLAGARGIVRKADPVETVLQAIESVHAGEMWLDRATTGRVFVELTRRRSGHAADPEQAKISTLTERERAVATAMAADPGSAASKIADSLHISEHTLRNHLTSIYGKLGVASRLDLYVFASKHGLKRPE